MDNDISEGLKIAWEQKQDAALITVSRVLGSTPRKPGAKMLVFTDGTTFGTIGGGCGEAEARREAFNVLEEHAPKKHYLNMTADMAQEEGMVCGGIMEMFIDYIGPQSGSEQVFKNYISAAENFSNPVLATLIAAPKQVLLGKKLFSNAGGEVLGDLGLTELNKIALEHMPSGSRGCQPVLITLDSELKPIASSGITPVYEILIELPTSMVQLLILGGGHIALPLATMAQMIGYEVTVVDDRPSFANSRRFNTAHRVICDDFERALDCVNINSQTYVVIITRGHRHDKVCLRKVINQPAGYIGMIGSKRRVKSMITEFQEEGVPANLLQKLYSPIGLKIGAETPEEIAVSILGELIKVHKGT